MSSTLAGEVLEQILTPGAAPTASQFLRHKLSRACLSEVPEGSDEETEISEGGSNWPQHRAGKVQAWDPTPKNIPAQVPNTKADSAPNQLRAVTSP